MAAIRRYLEVMRWNRSEVSAARDDVFAAPRLRRAIAALFMAVASASASFAAEAGESAPKAAQADGRIERFLARIASAQVDLPKPALSVVVGNQATILLAKGYGEASPGVPATADTVYHVGSIAKQFTAAAVLDLVSRGAVLPGGRPFALDRAVADIFDGVEHWPGIDAELGHQPVTLRSLLTMTSNLPNFTRLPPDATNPWGRISAPDLLSAIKRLRPSGWPNTFEYSNTSYFLLAEAMETAALPDASEPKSHQAYLIENIFPRAGLTRTGFVGSDAHGVSRASPIHTKKPVFDQPDWLKGSADITSSATDLYAWNRAFMDGRVLPAEYSALMVSDGARVTPDLYYGMGWFVEHRGGHDIFTHSGLVPGFTSYTLISAAPGNIAWTSVTLLVNSDAAPGLDVLAEELLHLFRD